MAGEAQDPYEDDMDTISTTSPSPGMEDYLDAMIEIQAGKIKRTPSDDAAKNKDKVT